MTNYVFVVGYVYDDFSDGGFDIISLHHSLKGAEISKQQAFEKHYNNWKKHRIGDKPSIHDYEIKRMIIKS